MTQPELNWSVRLFTIILLPGLLGGCMLMHSRGHGEHAGLPKTAVCPVCRTSLKVSKRTPRATSGGRLYFFASEEHLREFIKEPSRFPSSAAQAPSQGHDHGGGQP